MIKNRHQKTLNGLLKTGSATIESDELQKTTGFTRLQLSKNLSEMFKLNLVDREKIPYVEYGKIQWRYLYNAK